MWQQILPGLRIKLFLTVVCGILYPLLVTGISQMAFPHQANGSLVKSADGRVIGSELIGQNFTKPEYFQSRPSAAGSDGYDASASSGSNYGPTNQKLVDRVKASVEKFRKENPDFQGEIPADLLTASGSGLDPHLSPDAALAQAGRVARSRKTSVENVRNLIARHVESRDLGLLGEPRVNALRLNLALDQQFPKGR